MSDDPVSDDPVSDDAKQWNGWNTSLKPAIEPVVLARKPLSGTVGQCVLDHGTGALNIDGCRVGLDGGCRYETSTGGFDAGTVSTFGGHLNSCRSPQRDNLGRWPANLILSHHQDCRIVGTRASRDTAVQTVSTGEVVSDNIAMGGPNYDPTVVGTTTRPDEDVWQCHPDCPTQSFPILGDGGRASRFFYTPKADDDDRPHGRGTTSHPTVKPLDLMRYLCRLVCAPGGTVLDPFCGSGSTLVAAIAEGMRCVGIEQSQEYADIAVGRIKLALAQRGAKETPPPPRRLRG